MRNTLRKAVQAGDRPWNSIARPRRNTLFPRLRQVVRRGLRTQLGDDLGSRMERAFAMTLPSFPCLCRADCAALTAGDIRAARAALRDGMDAVLIPAEDGGYALIG